MEDVRTKIVSQIQHMLDHAVIKDRRFLDDEQLIRSEQLAVLEEIFNANIRDAEIRELSSHFAPILRGGHPCHMAIWGKTGTGKTLTMIYFLNLLSDKYPGGHNNSYTIGYDKIRIHQRLMEEPVFSCNNVRMRTDCIYNTLKSI